MKTIFSHLTSSRLLNNKKHYVKSALHWYQEPSVGRVEWKVKPDADGNWFIEDD